MILKAEGLTKYFGGLAAVSQVDIYLNHGEIAGLIGPNGAGKTTILNLINGFLRLTAGKIAFDGKDITGKKPHVLAKMGIGRTFQISPFFGEFSTLKNIVASSYLSAGPGFLGFWGAVFNSVSYRKREARILERAEENLEIVGLREVKNELAKNLPHGYQKVLDLARALAVKPKLLLMDEPIGGMDTEEIALARKAIEKVRTQGTAILLVEHNMEFVMSLCDRIIVIDYGKKVAEGSPEEIRRNEDVIRAYFGEQYVA